MADDRKTMDNDSKSVAYGETNSVYVVQKPPLIKDLSDEEYSVLEKKLIRKMDMRLMPMVILIYIMNYLDRNAIASARLGGLEEDLGLKGYEFQTCVAILNVGYLLMQVPSNLLLNKIGKPALYLTACMAGAYKIFIFSPFLIAR